MGRRAPGASTGVAVVVYYSDGSRNFLYHVRYAAHGLMNESDIDIEKLRGTKWMHITGFSMSISESGTAAVYRLISLLPPETKVSLDPNIRPVALSVAEIKRLCGPGIERASIIFPRKSEAATFTGRAGDDAGCSQ